jgi:hypothetical protein
MSPFPAISPFPAMSGTDLIRIISGIISIVDASLKIYETLEDASGLPRSFRDVAARLPIVQDTLETTKAVLEEEEEGEEIPAAKSRDALAKILESCFAKAASLNKTLQAVMPTEGASTTTRCLKAIKIFPTADKVDSLMNGILHDVHVLAANHSVKAATRTQVKNLVALVRRAEQRENSERRATIAFCNAGFGSQYIHDGQGNQNVSMGKGMQINGALTAPLYISVTR